MKFGIDFGTTRIVAACVDRGNYPVVSFETPEGVFDWFPAVVALRAMERLFGWQAWYAQLEHGWTLLPSLKPMLEDAGLETRLLAAGREYRLAELMLGVVSSLRTALQSHFGDHEPLEAVLGVPANANSNQRFLTVDAFRRAGFSVLGLLNEPSATSLEYGRRHTPEGRLLVYDLGGGRFDASLVEIDSDTRRVIASEGTSVLGGDDFALVLAELALGSEVVAVLEATDLFRLLEECRRQKEALHSSSRKIVLDLDAVNDGLGQATFSVSELYGLCRPLLEPSLESTRRLTGPDSIDAICVAGGGSEFPLVSRVLREEFGHKVKHSERARAATAIGLAIQADPNSGQKLREVFTRNFGVWREGYAGQLMIFDLIFSRWTRLPCTGEPPLSVHRRYSPVHNVGYFRYLEASNIDEFGEPAGDISVWDEILFPFDPALAESQFLEGLFPVTRSDRAAAQEIEERYTCDAAGVVTVSICNVTSHYGREYRLGQWSGNATVVPVPDRSKRGQSFRLRRA